MLKSDNFTMISLSLRDNFIKGPEVEMMIESLKINKTLIKFAVDYNPISQ